MVLYIGDKPVGLYKVVEKKVPKLKFGISIDNLLGDVDAQGNLVMTGEPFTVDLAGVKYIPNHAFEYFAANKKNSLENFHADDVTSVGNNVFANFAYNNTFIKNFSIGVTQITSNDVFYYAFSGATNAIFSFPKLKTVKGNDVFRYAHNIHTKVPNIEDIFPALEHVEGQRPFGAFSPVSNILWSFPSLISIVGGTTNTYATFANIGANAIFKLPKCTTISGTYVFQTTVTEIHFAAANQAAIEACEGYASKFGATNATIYFDL